MGGVLRVVHPALELGVAHLALDVPLFEFALPVLDGGCDSFGGVELAESRVRPLESLDDGDEPVVAGERSVSEYRNDCRNQKRGGDEREYEYDYDPLGGRGECGQNDCSLAARDTSGERRQSFQEADQGGSDQQEPGTTNPPKYSQCRETMLRSSGRRELKSTNEPRRGVVPRSRCGGAAEPGRQLLLSAPGTQLLPCQSGPRTAV